MSSYVTTNQLVSPVKTAALLGVPELQWHMATVEGPTFLGGAIPAIAAVASGSAEVCIAARSVLEAGGSYTKRPPPPVVGGDDQFTTPFGAHTSPHWISLYMRRHMADFGNHGGALRGPGHGASASSPASTRMLSSAIH